MYMNQQKFGNFISELRRDKNLTQQELAKKLGVTDKAVSKWERGLSCPDISLLIPISDILGVTINELLLGESINNTSNMGDIESINKKVIEYSNREMNIRKKRNNKLFFLLIISFIMIVLIVTSIFINYYISERESRELDSYIERVKSNLKDLKFKKDNPLHTPNSVLTIDSVTYVVPRISYKYNDKEICKDILSYSDYNNLTGLIIYYNGNIFTVFEYRNLDKQKVDMVSIDCDFEGNLIVNNNYTKEQKELYENNVDEIKTRINNIRMMWINVYEF